MRKPNGQPTTLLILVAAVATIAVLAIGWPGVARDRFDSALVDLINQAVTVKTGQAPTACSSTTDVRRTGLTIRNGNVVGAELIKEIGGYAASAQTTGGLGGRLLVVTSAEDYDPDKRDAPIQGSLRERLEHASRQGMPAWIVFDPALGQGTRIHLKHTLRVPSNVTIDGSCADITLEAPDNSKTILFLVATGTQNVIIARLALRKTDYLSELHPDNDSAIRINGDVDRIAILHNDLFECGDGCIDVTAGRARPARSGNITVAYNFVHDHDKVMLFGTWDCPNEQCDQAYFSTARQIAPILRLTLEGNLFLRTGQRHPRVWGQVTAHIVNNVVAFQPLGRPRGGLGNAYGVFVADGARALVEHNLFAAIPPRRKPPLAVWTVASPGAMRVPGSVEAFVRLRENQVTDGAVATPSHPQDVPDPPYIYKTYALERLSLERAIECLSERSGRTGASDWSEKLCSP